MEFWEGAILVVGGVWLVSYMANRNKQAAQTVAGTSILGSAGTSNQSNLTNLTNTAGGVPTIAGESLVPFQPSVAGGTQGPFLVASLPPSTPTTVPTPVAVIGTPIVRSPMVGAPTSNIRVPMGAARLQLL